MKEKDKLPIPVNVPEQKDVFPGIGTKEIGIIAITAFLDILLILFINALSGSLIIAIFVGFGVIALVIMAIRRDRFNESVIDKTRIVFQFSDKQKKYLYKFYDMYKCEDVRREE